MLQIFSVIILGYLLGSIPTSLTLGKIHSRIDIRKHGSGNAGLTNVYRVLGIGPALVVAIADIFKGWLAAALIPLYFSHRHTSYRHSGWLFSSSWPHFHSVRRLPRRQRSRDTIRSNYCPLSNCYPNMSNGFRLHAHNLGICVCKLYDCHCCLDARRLDSS